MPDDQHARITTPPAMLKGQELGAALPPEHRPVQSLSSPSNPMSQWKPKRPMTCPSDELPVG
jgi:hypothetical protein